MKYLIIGLIAFGLASCGKSEHEPFSQPFIHIMENNSSYATVNAEATVLREYNIYLSSAPQTENVEVTFEIIVGSGLTEGVDFEIITKERKLVFLPGIYDVPVRIRWLPNANLGSATRENTLTIALVSNNKGYNLGLPGPDQLQKQFVITKVK